MGFKAGLFGFFSVALLSGCANALRDLPDKQSDDYKLSQAKLALDKYLFDDAITYITPVLAHQPANGDVVYVASAAYAGRAGLRIIDLFASLSSDLSTKSLLEVFSEHFSGSDDQDVADMETSMNILESYGARAANRTVELNFYALFLFYSRIGVILNRYGYDGANVKRGNFRACHKDVAFAGATTGLPNDMVDRILTTVPRILETIPAIGTGSGLPADALDTSLLPTGLPFDPSPTCAAGETANNCLAARTFVSLGLTSTPQGIGLDTGEGICLTVDP